MEITVRPLLPSDYNDILVGWWNEWGWTPPVADFLPDGGKGGVMVMCGDTPVCAGFLYLTNSKVAWLEFTISNKSITDRDVRRVCLETLVSTLTDVAGNVGYKFIYSLVKNQSLRGILSDAGYIEGDSNATEMIKSI